MGNEMEISLVPIIIVVIVAILLCVLASCIKIVPQAQAFIVERLGGYQCTWSVGLHFKVPIIDKVARKVLLKEQVMDFPYFSRLRIRSFLRTGWKIRLWQLKI